ncbi:hypothetical protein GCM10019059_35870 [Camelimonas fluminis]|uniref:Transposase n=1 Tax=Camelimonas fluminis TaxID=1576911 RepID=A0ABV7UHG6_9HYPH|nr:hypothetical protein [Camelimonas fluminis]GHE73140.1 hypothetical protein GCM10019059_35870 [Camelimonas fluminis]
MLKFHPQLISDRIRLALSLLRCGYTPTSAAIRASVTEAELTYWQEHDDNGLLPREAQRPKKMH